MDHIDGSLVQLIIGVYLRFKIENGAVREVLVGEAVDTIRRVVNQYDSDRSSILLKEFLIDLRNTAKDEGYALCDIGVDENLVIDPHKLREELGE